MSSNDDTHMQQPANFNLHAMKYIIYIIILAFAFSGCSNKQSSLPNNMLNEKLISIARNKIVQTCPECIGNRQPQIFDKGDHWEVAFLSPQTKEGIITVGGEPVAWIDKKTMEVIQLYLMQ